MCDYFWQRMDSCADRGGDLADVVRSVAGASPSTSSPDTSSTWQFQIDPPAASPVQQQLSTDDFAPAGDGFGLRDPLLNELAGAAFFDCGGSGGGAGSEKSGSDGGCSSVAGVAHHHERLLTADEMKRPCSNLFSRVLQISPAKPSPLPPRAMKPLLMGAGDMVKLDHGAQISSPRTQGIKRRKGQTKKVVCIPAPAAASNKPGGEVVPSDLWAWRKYGQKPIKGSPYPRGYYRCSSSKGCSARKQVERSRTDPNMLVITYTSEHNHPWPTQRNALAGSTRSHPSKNSSSSSASSASKSSSPHHNNNNNNQSRQPTPNLKEEPRESTATTTSSSLPMVKEEVVGEMENVDAITMVNDNAFDNAFYNGPVMAENQPDDFFADLAELEPDPMSLILSRPGGFIGEKPEEEEEEDGRGKGMNQFINMFDWGGSTFGDHQSKKGL